MNNESKGIVKMSINISQEALDMLRAIARRRGVTVTEVLRRAINLEKYVDDVQRENGKILVETSKGQIREVVFG